MPIKFTSSDLQDIPANALFVAAGTVNIDNVSEMGAGFKQFKRLFRDATDSEGNKPWQEKMQDTLDTHIANKTMPPYIPMAKKDRLSGGVASVPRYDKTKNQDEAYKAAIKGAMDAAIQLHKPLILQPLGIGQYGWPSDLAARLTAEVIKSDPKYKQLDINIPIHFDLSNTAAALLQNQRNHAYATTLSTLLDMPAPLPLAPTTERPPTSSSTTERAQQSETTVKPTGIHPKIDLDTIIKAYEQQFSDKAINEEGSPYRYQKDERKNQICLAFQSEKERDDFLSKLAQSGISFIVKDTKGNVIGMAKDGGYHKSEGPKTNSPDAMAAPSQPQQTPISQPPLAIKKAEGISDIKFAASLASTIREMETTPKPRFRQSKEGHYNMTFANDTQRDEFLQRLSQKINFSAKTPDSTFGYSDDGNFIPGAPPTDESTTMKKNK